MSNRRSIVLLLIVLIASIAAHLALSWREPILTARRGSRLLGAEGTPTRLTIRRAGSPTTVLERTDRWNLTAPYAGRVNEQTVQRLLDTLTSAEVLESMSPRELLRQGLSPDELGVEDSSLHVTLASDAECETLDFGDLSPASNGVFVCVGAARNVLLVPPAIRAAVDVDASFFRDRRAFDASLLAVTSFDLRRPGNPPVRFTREGEDWKVDGRTASSVKVREFLSVLSDLTASDFVWPVGASNEATVVSAPLLSGYGLDAESAVVVSLHAAEGRDGSLVLGNETADGHVYALIHDGREIVTVKAAVKTLARQEFVDARIFPFEANDVTGFVLTRGERRCALIRGTNDTWRLESPIRADADEPTVRQWLSCLLKLTTPALAADGVSVAFRTNEPPIVVSEAALAELEPWENLRSRKVVAVDPARVRRLVVSYPSDATRTVSIVSSRERRGWNVEDGTRKGAVSLPRLAKFLQTLNPLTAARVVVLRAAEVDLSRAGLLTPYCSISIDQEQGDGVRRNLLIGRETKGGRFATIGLTDAVFVIPQEAVDALTADLIEE